MEEKLKSRDFTTTPIHRFQTFVEFEIGKEQDKTRVQLAYDSPFRFDYPVNSDIGVKVNDYKDISHLITKNPLFSLFFPLKTQN